MSAIKLTDEGVCMGEPGWLLRFYSLIGPTDQRGCWPWAGRTQDSGRGVFHMFGRKILASHVALSVSGDTRPDGLGALHSCDNPNCVNPDHLRWGTQAENMAEMASKGRGKSPKGEAAPLAKLTDDAVREIRRSPLRNIALAEMYGVDRSKISRIKNRKAWAHVEG